MVKCDNFVRAKIRKSIFNTVGEKLHLLIWIPIFNTPFPIDKRKATFNAHNVYIFIILHSFLIRGGNFIFKSIFENIIS
jgi:hypothetical protein